MGQNDTFSFYAKHHRILRSYSMKIFFNFVNFISLNIYFFKIWLVICIAKNLIWTTLKMIFSILWFFAPSDSRFTNIVQTIHQWKYYWFSKKYWPLWLGLSTDAVISSTGIFVKIANNTLYGSKLLIFLFCKKSSGY